MTVVLWGFLIVLGVVWFWVLVVFFVWLVLVFFVVWFCFLLQKPQFLGKKKSNKRISFSLEARMQNEKCCCY